MLPGSNRRRATEREINEPDERKSVWAHPLPQDLYLCVQKNTLVLGRRIWPRTQWKANAKGENEKGRCSDDHG